MTTGNLKFWLIQMRSRLVFYFEICKISNNIVGVSVNPILTNLMSINKKHIRNKTGKNETFWVLAF